MSTVHQSQRVTQNDAWPSASPSKAHAPTERGAAVGFGESRRPDLSIASHRIRLSAFATSNLRLPPFGKELLAELAKGRRPNVRLFCDRDAWVRAEQWRVASGPGSALVLPHGADPEMFRWPPIDGLVVTYRDRTPGAMERKRQLALALIRDGVDFVLLEHAGQPIIARAAKGGA